MPRTIDVINSKIPAYCKGHDARKECTACHRAIKTAALLAESGRNSGLSNDDAVAVALDYIAIEKQCEGGVAAREMLGFSLRGIAEQQAA